MRAIRIARFGEPDVMRVEEVPEPVPRAGQVVVRVRAAGVNPVETYIRSGAYPSRPELPYTPGSDAGGEVEAVGENVSFKPADRIFTSGALSGTYAEKALCDASQVHPLPGTLSFAQGAALGVPYATAWRALFQRAQAKSGEIVLVHGASGGVGLAAVQMGRAAGLTVIATAGSDVGRALVAAQGASHVLDHGKSNHLDDAVRIAHGEGLDVIVEMLANVNLGRDLGALGPGGRVVVVGSRGTVEINPRDLMNRDAAILGMRLPNASPAECASLWAGIVAGLEMGTLKPVVARELPLAEAPRAHREILSEHAGGKIVLVP